MPVVFMLIARVRFFDVGNHMWSALAIPLSELRTSQRPQDPLLVKCGDPMPGFLWPLRQTVGVVCFNSTLTLGMMRTTPNKIYRDEKIKSTFVRSHLQFTQPSTRLEHHTRAENTESKSDELRSYTALGVQ